MGRRGVWSLILWGLGFGLLIAVPPGEDRRLSIDLWLIGVTVWLGVGLAARALGVVPVGRRGLRPPLRIPLDRDYTLRWRWPFLVRRRAPEPPAPRSLLALEGTLLASVDNPRAFAHRLRPRLREVTAHRLAVDQGIDLDRDPGRARTALGDLAWLIEPGSADRTPTPDDVARLLDRVEPDPSPRTADHERIP